MACCSFILPVSYISRFWFCTWWEMVRNASCCCWLCCIFIVLIQTIQKNKHIINSTPITRARLWFFQWSCMDVRVRLWRKLSTEELMLLKCGVGEDSWESLGLQGDQTSQSWRKSLLNIHWKDWCWSWNSNTLATWCEELIHWEKP